MTLIFFPFTYIPPGSAGALRACFSRMTVLQPAPGGMPADMEEMAASGWLDVRMPAGVDSGRLQAVIKEYRGWADVHQGRRGLDSGFFRSLGDKTPFWGETAPSRIRDAIRGQGKVAVDGDGDSSLLPDLIFLSMAQEFDIQSQGVHEDLKDVAHMEAELFGQLKGEANGIRQPIAAQGVQGAATPGEYMLPERLSAWRRLLVPSCGADSVFLAAITTSLAVIAHLREKMEDLKEVGRIEQMALTGLPEESMERWHQELAGIFRTLATVGEAGADGMPDPPVSAPPNSAGASLTLYVCPGIGLKDFLTAAERKNSHTPIRKKTVNTVIGLVQVTGTLDPDQTL